VKVLCWVSISLALLCGVVRGQDAGTAAAVAGSMPAGGRRASVVLMGDQVTLDLRGVSLLEALRIISEKTGMKFVVPGDLAVLQISVYLREVPIDLAMRAILSANGLYMERQGLGDIYVVKSLEKVPPLHIAVITLKHIEAREIENIVKSNLSLKGQVVIDARSNALVVRDTEESVDLIRRVVALLDMESPQVLIRAHIVEVESSAEKQLGIDWSTAISAHGSAQAIVAPFSSKRPWIYNTPRPGAGEGGIDLSPTFAYGKLDFTGLGATLRFLEDKGVAKVLASPSIATRNDQEATIKIVRHMALTVQTVFDDSGNIVQRVPIYGDVGITLVTKPWVNEDGLVTLQIEPTVSSAEQSSFFEEAVDTKTRTAKTEVTVRDGDVIVIGGLLRTDVIQTKKKVPVLGSIPLLGRLFSYERKVKNETDLVIFVSPLVLKDKNIDKKARQEKERLEGWESAHTLLRGRTAERSLFELPGLDPADPHDKIKRIKERRKAARAESARTTARRIPLLDGREKRPLMPAAPALVPVRAPATPKKQPERRVTQSLVVKVDRQPDVVVTEPKKATPEPTTARVGDPPQQGNENVALSQSPAAASETVQAGTGPQGGPENVVEAADTSADETAPAVVNSPAGTGAPGFKEEDIIGPEDVGEQGSPITRAFDAWLSMGPDVEDAEEIEEDNATPVIAVPDGDAGMPHAKAAPAGRTTDAAFATWLQSADKETKESKENKEAQGKGEPAPREAETSETASAGAVVLRDAAGK